MQLRLPAWGLPLPSTPPGPAQASGDAGSGTRRAFLRSAGAAALTAPALAGAVGVPAAAAQATGGGAVFDVTAFGAVGDGVADATAAIQAAVDACAAGGGGQVLVPAGAYVSAPIFLRSNVHVHLGAGATLLGSTRMDQYPTIQGRWEGIERTVFASLFTGEDLDNVSITGPGTIDARGQVWWDAFVATRGLRQRAGLVGREPDSPPDAPLPWPRPRSVNLYRCRRVTIRDVTILDSPSWGIHLVYCENLLVDGVTVVQPQGPNTDGVDLDSCRNVRIANCWLDTADDCIAVKSGYNADGRRVGRPSAEIVIANCTLANGRAGVALGSETSGGIRDVLVTNCLIRDTSAGLRVKTARGRGAVVENFRATNVVMRNCKEEAVSVTMFFEDDRREPLPVDAGTPTVRNLHLTDLTIVESRKAGNIEGLPERPIESLVLENVVVDTTHSGITCANVRQAHLAGLSINAANTPAIVLEGVQQVEVHRVGTPEPNQRQPVLRFEGVDDAFIQSCNVLPGTGTFLELAGPANREITLGANRLRHAARPVELVGGATEAALTTT